MSRSSANINSLYWDKFMDDLHNFTHFYFPFDESNARLPPTPEKEVCACVWLAAGEREKVAKETNAHKRIKERLKMHNVLSSLALFQLLIQIR